MRLKESQVHVQALRLLETRDLELEEYRERIRTTQENTGNGGLKTRRLFETTVLKTAWSRDATTLELLQNKRRKQETTAFSKKFWSQYGQHHWTQKRGQKQQEIVAERLEEHSCFCSDHHLRLCLTSMSLITLFLTNRGSNARKNKQRKHSHCFCFRIKTTSKPRTNSTNK